MRASPLILGLLAAVGCKRPALETDAGGPGILPDAAPIERGSPVDGLPAGMDAGDAAPALDGPAPTPDASCGVIKSLGVIVPVSILVLVDQSVAGDKTKWADVISVLSDTVTANSRDVDWGLYAFPQPGPACGAGTVPASVDVPVTTMNASVVAAAIPATRTDGSGAPTAAAITAGAAYLRALSAKDGARFMLLATDHAPSCAGQNGTLSADPVQAQADAVAAIQAAAAGGIRTVVLAPSTTVGSDADALNALAQAGGVQQLPPGPAFATESTLPLLFSPPEPQSCILNVPFAPDGSRLLVTSVVLNGQTVPRDPLHMSGWDFTSPTEMALQLYGSWCQMLIDGNSRMTEVDIYYACDTR
ncbi:MAG TPA: hypothetical protein VKQ32_29400 [Polyangia bacterium]|nr:hypothetical protein [Polyangia bacterium]